VGIPLSDAIVLGVLAPRVQADDVEGDLDEVAESARTMWDSFLESLPRIGVAALVVLVFWLVGRLVRWVLARHLRRRRTLSFARVISRLAGVLVTLFGVMVALAVTFPSVEPVNLLSGAGLLTVAVGFAFQDILQNLLAGVLLLFRQPFQAGDQIKVGDVAGTVQEITVRETIVTTFDGRTVLIPNATVYTDVMEVQTAAPTIRIEVSVGIEYAADPLHAAELLRAAVAELDEVVDDPPPEVLVSELAASAVVLDVLVWCRSRQLETRRVRSQVVTACLVALQDADIDIPFEIVTFRPDAELKAVLSPEGGEEEPS
jgi:small conductance mechanosensitive channel